MKHLLAMLVFVAGGLATELVHTVQCSLINTSRVQVRRQKR